VNTKQSHKPFLIKPTLVYKQILTLVTFLASTSLMAQKDFRKNDMYFELLGNGIGASVNYERQLQDKPGLGVRIGIGYFSGDEQFRVSIPLGVNYLFQLGNNKSFLDAGLSGTWSGAAGLKTVKQETTAGGVRIRDYNERIWSAVPSIGYRRHTKGNFMWRTSFTPILNKYRTMPWFGISIGKRF
jgi:hypothetical protein